ncbi:MAG: RICIN domain-containing protein, partial [Lachnospiraceae bacterium]|nr:RICIN domain-containing protein [Lachnospiraceae bacterium]
GYVTLKNGLGYMLDVRYGTNSDGENIQTYSANGADAQKFKVVNTSNAGVYGITTKVSNDQRGLDVANFGTADGVNVCQWTYGAKSNQTWVFEPCNTVTGGTISNGWYYIKGVHSQKYLQVAGNAGANSVNVEIGTGTGVKGQKWYVTNTGDGYVTLKNGQGYMLDVQYGANDDGTNIQTYSANGADAQKFKIEKISSGTYGITTKVSSGKKGLDVSGYGTADGTNICQWSYKASSNQQWIFEPCNN